MIAYCTEMSLKKCINAPSVGYYGTKWRMTSVVVMNGSPAKVLWYLPIIPRFKRLFVDKGDTKDLTWHADGRNCNGMLCHPIDSSQQKKINHLYPDFGKEARNLRLRIATNGMNPFDNLNTNHSSWPILLVIYNLHP